MYNPESVLENAQTSLGFWNTNGSLNLGQTTISSDCQQNKQNLPNSRLCRSGWPQIKKMIQSEKKNKYLDLARELESFET